MNFLSSLILLVLLFTSCSHQKPSNNVSFITASNGLMKNKIAPFPIYLTDKLENRGDLEKKYSNDIFIVHTGHILKPDLSKEENEKQLKALSECGFNLVNLTLEDFIIADNQGIHFEDFDNISFINSSVIDLNLDSLASAKNISSSLVLDEVAFIGLSDTKLNKKLSKEKFIISDYVLSILKVKKAALKMPPTQSIKSFIIIHNLGSEINDVMVRLPPTFINSLAN